MAATKQIPSIDDILDTIPQKTPEHILKWFQAEHIKQGEAKQYDDQDLQNLFSSLIGLSEPTANTRHRQAINKGDLTLNNFLKLVMNPKPPTLHQQDLPVYIKNPSNDKPAAIPQQSEKDTPEQQQARQDAIGKNKDYDRIKSQNEFFAGLMKGALDREMQTALDFWREQELIKVKDSEDALSNSENKLPNIKQRFKIAKQKRAIDRGVKYVKDFETHLANTRKKQIDPHRAEDRYVFKAKAAMYQLLIDPSIDGDAHKNCMSISKELSGKLEPKYIVIGLILLAASIAIIGVTCGIAAGVILPGLVLGSMLGVGLLSGGFGIGTMLGVTAIKGSQMIEDKSKGKVRKGGIYNGAPGLNRGLSFHATRATKAIGREATSVEIAAAGDATRHQRNAEQFGYAVDPDAKTDFGGTPSQTGPN